MFLYIILVSLCFGSFVNVLIYRLPLGENVVFSRSYCPSCKHQLKAKDLIPIVSFCALKGKCRYCQEKISLRYPLIELVSAFVGIYCFQRYGIGFQAILTFIVIEILLTISIIDIHHLIIPDELTFLLFLCATLRIHVYHINPLIQCIRAIILPTCMIIINKIKESFGGGDIKLLFVMGYYLGFPRLPFSFLYATLFAGIYAIYLLFRKKANRHSYIAFAPFLALGFLLYL